MSCALDSVPSIKGPYNPQMVQPQYASLLEAWQSGKVHIITREYGYQVHFGEKATIETAAGNGRSVREVKITGAIATFGINGDETQMYFSNGITVPTERIAIEMLKCPYDLAALVLLVKTSFASITQDFNGSYKVQFGLKNQKSAEIDSKPYLGVSKKNVKVIGPITSLTFDAVKWVTVRGPLKGNDELTCKVPTSIKGLQKVLDYV